MSRYILLLFLGNAILALSTYGQNVPPPPVPIIETEIRENSTRIRAIEMERIKRESNKIKPRKSDPYSANRFKETKKRFESIQRSQSEIVRSYTHYRQINYGRIRRYAIEIADDASKLDVILFGAEPVDGENQKQFKGEKKEAVRDLIIDLDRSIAKFVNSKMFRNPKVVEQKMAAKAQERLRRVYELSVRLSAAAAVSR